MKGLIRTLCCALAVLLLVLSLMTQIRANGVRDECEALRREKMALESEIRILDVRLALRLPLAELERLAEERLGMRPCRGEQIVVLRLEELEE